MHQIMRTYRYASRIYLNLSLLHFTYISSLVRRQFVTSDDSCQVILRINILFDVEQLKETNESLINIERITEIGNQS